MMADTFKQAVSELTHMANETVNDLDLFGAGSRDQVSKWNSEVPARINKCAHDIIYERCLDQPDAPAVCSWDGNFTYSEVDALA